MDDLSRHSPLQSLGQIVPINLEPLFKERVWGCESLEPYFPKPPGTEHIGEVWFTFNENRTSSGQTLGALLLDHPALLGTAADPKHPGVCPLLVKLLFTTERLSVQVHPNDEYAHAHHQSLGKTEAWYVMESRPPGEVAVGFRETLSPERLRDSAISGEIEGLLDWRKVSKGDVVFTPAGTVHAIGAGVTICEIQENSDITYRLYDYGRPRELHLEHSMKVSDLGPHSADARTVPLSAGRDELLSCEYFRIEKLQPKKSFTIAPGAPYYFVLICVANSPLAGQAWLIPAGGSGMELEAPGSEWILTYTADEPFTGVSVS